MIQMLLVVLFTVILYSQESHEVHPDSIISVYAHDVVELVNDRAKLHRLEAANIKKDSAIVAFMDGFKKIPKLKAFVDSLETQVNELNNERKLESRAWEKLTKKLEKRIRRGNRLVASAVVGSTYGIIQSYTEDKIDILQTSIVTFTAWLLQYVGIWSPKII